MQLGLATNDVKSDLASPSSTLESCWLAHFVLTLLIKIDAQHQDY